MATAKLNHIISATQFSTDFLTDFTAQCYAIEQQLKNKKVIEIARGRILATLFYECSTRTRLSFETAMLRLGGQVISETDVSFSSIIKGEKIQDTIRVISSYSDLIALRSKEEGQAVVASQYASVPIINGGDGKGEHPTQSLLDFYTIYKSFPKHFKTKKTLKLVFAGDLKYGRTVHSLSKLLRNYPFIEITFVAPEAFQIPDNYWQEGDNKLHTIADVNIQNSDIIYLTRLQKERLNNLFDEEEISKAKKTFTLTEELVQQMPQQAIIMHPLPRLEEIPFSIDRYPQAKYFEQTSNGLPVRMALIKYCLQL